MRIVIDMGHTPTSPGASGYLDELSRDRDAGARIISELERRGHTVYDSTAPDYMAYPDEVNYRVRYTNNLSNIDLFCSLHLNAGGGHGTEVLYFAGDSKGERYASIISDNVARALELPNRGAKANDWVGVICNTWPTAVLIEFCFVDNYDDAEAWHAAPWADIVNAVCDGIEGKKWVKSAPQPEPQPEPEPAKMPITGESKTTVAQMAKYYADKGKEYPSSVYTQYGAQTINAFCRTLFEEAAAENIRAEVVFAQAMLETGWLQFGGDVKPEQCNFCGLGATGGVPGASFNTYGRDSVRMGLRAQIQHLKAYANKDALSNPCIDPRFDLVTRGCAPTVEALGGKWAPSATYGERVRIIADELLTVDTADYEPEPMPEPEPQPPVDYDERINALEKLLEQILERIGGEIDYEKLASAVNDDVAKRMKE